MWNVTVLYAHQYLLYYTYLHAILSTIYRAQNDSILFTCQQGIFVGNSAGPDSKQPALMLMQLHMKKCKRNQQKGNLSVGFYCTFSYRKTTVVILCHIFVTAISAGIPENQPVPKREYTCLRLSGMQGFP